MFNLLPNFFSHIKLRFKTCLSIVFLGWFITHSNAANQGAANNTSNGDINITLTLGLLSRITGLNDFTFGTWTSGNLTANDNLCIGLFGTNQYKISAQGSGDGSDVNAYAVTNGSDYLPYRVFFNDQANTTGQTELFSSTILSGQNANGSFLNLFGCFSENANLDILLANNDLTTAGSGNYIGQLTVTLIPE